MKAAYRLLSSAMHSSLSFNQRVRLARPGGPACLFRDSAVALPSLLNRTRAASIHQRDVFASGLVPIAHRQCHCAALAGNTDDTAAATAAAAAAATGEQSAEADVQQVDSGPQNDSVAAVERPNLHGSTPGWPAFLQKLWSRGYFEENSSGKDM